MKTRSRKALWRATSIFILLFLVVTIHATHSGATGMLETAVSPNLSGNTVYLPVMYRNFDASLDTPIFGVQMYGSTRSNGPYHPYLIDSGASWLRVPATWASAEPTRQNPPVYQWGSIDSSLAAARQDMGGLNLVVTIERAPDWAAEHFDGPIKPEYLPAFAQFVGALVERYNGNGVNDAPGSPVVKYWEFYNEPDNNSSQWPMRWGNHGQAYANMLATVYPVIKAANPNAKVVMGGLAYDWFEDQNGPFVRRFLDDVLSAGGGQYFDIMNIHYYPAFAPNWTTEPGTGLKEKVQHVRGVLQNYGLNKPIIITEAGWHDNSAPQSPSTPEIQSRYVVTLFTQSIASDVPIMIWWMLYDVGGFYPYNTGLVTNVNAGPIQKKLSFEVYRRIVAQLSTAHFVRTLTPAETGNSHLEVHKFTDNVKQRTVYVAWLNPINTNDTKPLRLPAATATIRDSITGAVNIVHDGSDGVIDGKITIQVSGRPVYVEVDK